MGAALPRVSGRAEAPAHPGGRVRAHRRRLPAHLPEMTTPSRPGARLALVARRSAGQPTEHCPPGFGQVTIYAPRGPEEVVLFVSGDGGWNDASRWRSAAGSRALVVGIDTRVFLEASRPRRAARTRPGISRSSRGRSSYGGGCPPTSGRCWSATRRARRSSTRRSSRRRRKRSRGRSASASARTSRSTMRRVGSAGSSSTRPKGVGSSWPLPRPRSAVDRAPRRRRPVCDPKTTGAFVAGTGAAWLFPPAGRPRLLVARNWEPQFIDSYRAVASAPRPLPSTGRRRASRTFRSSKFRRPGRAQATWP